MAVKDVPLWMVCKAYSRFRRDNSKFPYQLLSEWTGQPEKVCYRAMEKADRKGLIDYGVSLRTGWLTDSGKRLLEEHEGGE